ncbi:hypothetical protein KBD49_12310 [Myxococcota bacterium]|nr:hypothetical protein [Myxococcota bacterium]
MRGRVPIAFFLGCLWMGWARPGQAREVQVPVETEPAEAVSGMEPRKELPAVPPNATTGDPEATAGDRIPSSRLALQERPETWDQPPTPEQLSLDPTLIPPGKGAIFVPAMTDPRLEPHWLVIGDHRKVLESLPTGRRAILPPGIYEVRLGSGSLEERIRRRVLVREGRTTVIPATWSTLVVQVVDDHSQPFRGSYELLRLPDRRNLGLGLGADVETGEEPRSWVLEPGDYMLLKTGENPTARRDFYTFRLRPGERSVVTLVMDRDSGNFLGAGEVPVKGLRARLPKDWTVRLAVGADAEFNRRSDLAGFTSGYGFTLGGYLDLMGLYRPRQHYLYLRLKLEEKQVKIPNQPFQKDLDELKADALYVYRVLPWLGPYVRVGGATALFPGYAWLGSPTEVVEVDGAGQPLRSLGVFEGKYRLSSSLAPTEVKGGAGLGFLVTGVYWFDANVRIGVGTRYLWTRGLMAPAGSSTSPRTLYLRRKDNAWQTGIEGTVIASLRWTRWLLATLEFEALEPFTDFRHPILSWDSNVGIRLASFVSVNYLFRMILDRDRSEHLQTEHRVLLRFTWQIL